MIRTGLSGKATMAPHSVPPSRPPSSRRDARTEPEVGATRRPPESIPKHLPESPHTPPVPGRARNGRMDGTSHQRIPAQPRPLARQRRIHDHIEVKHLGRCALADRRGENRRQLAKRRVEERRPHRPQAGTLGMTEGRHPDFQRHRIQLLQKPLAIIPRRAQRFASRQRGQLPAASCPPTRPPAPNRHRHQRPCRTPGTVRTT